MPITVNTPVQICVAFYGVTLSRYHSLGSLQFNLLPNFLTVITLISDEGICRWELGNQRGGLSTIIDLASRDFKLDGQATGVNRQVNLAGIASSTFPSSLIVTAGSACAMLESLELPSMKALSRSGSTTSTLKTLSHLPAADHALKRGGRRKLSATPNLSIRCCPYVL